MNRHRNDPKDTMDRKWRRWSKRSNEEIGRPLSVSDTFSGLMDIRRLAGTPSEPAYDTGRSVITLSGRLPPSPSLVQPIQLNQARMESSEWKIGLAAVLLAAVVVATLAVAVLLREPGQSATAPVPSAGPQAAIVPTSAEVDEIVPSSIASPERSDGERRRTNVDDVRKYDDVRPPSLPAVDGPPSLPAVATEDGTSKKTSTKKDKKRNNKNKKSNSGKPVLAFAEPSTDGERPKTLSRTQVKAGLRSVAPKVKRCGKGTSGLVVMDVVIGKNGRVIRAHATGGLAGTKTGKCAARAVKGAVFPQFSGPRIGVKFPFQL